MKREKNLKRPIVSFILLTNIIFWPLFLLVGAASLLGFPSVVFDILFIISAWSSTIAFFILFKRIYPEQRFIHFVKEKFNNKIKLSVAIIAIMIQVLIFGIIVLIVASNTNGTESIYTVSSFGMLIYFFFKTLCSGPLGEELGWRGFAQNELQKKYSPLKSSIIIGFWWGLWHLPIWFTTGLTGIELIKYIVFFMIAIITTKIMMTAFYNLNQNLIIPIIIHQFFNFFIGIINGNLIDLIMYSAILYGIVAVILIVINPKKVLYK
ncbi:CPBP family intramembrane glutamic endopeptidase [Paenibacillus yanchengensis]|uniref:CPBP family intramembrane glutamic endopeptidase n=1 Tax=Paenibacillus yanchengensis TaxID=2035833 RepID=A0ABW4YPU7_9BACL